MSAHSRAWTARRISAALVAFVALLAMLAATSLAPADAATARKKHKPPFAVSLSLSRSSISPGGSVGLSGHVGPTRKAKKRTVAVQRRIGSGGWVTIAHQKLTKSARYAVTLRLSSGGTYAFRVVMPKSKKRSAGVSAARTVQVGPEAWRSVSGGGNHSCGLKVDGSLWCWGSNQFGQLGSATNVGTATAVTRPVRVGASTAWVAVKAGNNLTCGVMRNHTAWCWGQNNLGQLGNTTNSGTNTPNRTPLAVAGGAVWASAVTETSGSTSPTTCGTRIDRSLYCWGSDSNGQLGNGAADNTPHPTPVRVGSDNNWNHVATGRLHTCGTRVDGSLWCWGGNTYGQQGNGATGATNVLTATRVGTSFAWTSVVSGFDTSCATQSDRSVWCWGYNGTGPAGGTTSPRSTPGIVAGTPANVAQLSVGGDHSCVLTSSGAISCWGTNSSRELGSSTAGATNPTPLAGPTGPWSSLSNGGFHTCAVRGGVAWCWGSNANGQLGTAAGLGSTTFTPRRVGS